MKVMFHVFTSHLRPVFEGAAESRIFSVPEPRRKLGIIPNLRAYIMEVTVRRATSRNSLRSVLRQRAVFKGRGNFALFQVPDPRGKLGIFSKSQSLGESADLEFLQVPGLI